MTVEVQDPFNSYTAAPGATVFPYGFKIVSPTDLIATIDDIVIEIGIDFSLSGVGSNDGGDLTLFVPLTGGQDVLLKRQMTFDRETDYQQNGDFNAQVVNSDFDRVWLAMQQLGQDLKRSIKTAFTETTDQTIPASPSARANKALVFDESGNVTASVDDYNDQAAAASASAAAAAASQNASAANAAQTANDRIAAAQSAQDAENFATSVDPSNIVHRTGNESIAGIKAFTDSPTVPTPTSSNQAANKSYVDQLIVQLPFTGLIFSTPGASNAMTISAGRAVDSTGSVVMSLASSITKTTAAWAVGNAGGLDTGTIANNTWYHFYEIRRPDTGVVDVTFSLSPTAPNLPANYTQYRHIGPGFINAITQWRRFFHDGDDWQWETPTLDIDVTGPGATAVPRVLAVPTGIPVIAKFNCATYDPTNANGIVGYFSDLRVQDLAPSNASAPLSASSSASQSSVGGLSTQEVRTNGSAQIRSRISVASGTAVLKMSTLGWTYKRGG